MRICPVMIAIGILFLSACSGGYERVPDEAIDQTELAKAEGLAMKILEACDAGGFAHLTTNEATLTMVDGLTPDRQREACDFLEEKYGTLEGLSIGEVLQTVETADFRIYRFKGSFKETKELVEVRITLDKNGKMSGLWTMPWVEGL
ncbi:MAG: hypothetical protein HRU41_10700 [Saprospiraceae bacterium]|nr:hypothetical protein [Saprospiraceae bacterium]